VKDYRLRTRRGPAPGSTYRPFYWLRRLAVDPDAAMVEDEGRVSCELEGTEDGLAPRVVIREHGEPVGSLGPADELGPAGELKPEATE